VSHLDLTQSEPAMNPTRLAAAVAIAAAGLLLFGCNAGTPAKSSWHAAPAPSASAGGGGGGDPGVLVSAQASAGANGVHTTTGGEAVALTFDDGPDPTYTPQILALLRRYQVKATFCLVGMRVQEYPQLVRDIVADGHTLCNHTWKHDMHLGTRDEAAIRADLQRTSDAIHAAAPDAPIRYFRHPGGNFTPRAVGVAQSMGMASIGWQVDTMDWNINKYPAGPTMRDHVISVLRTQLKPGAIVLSHDAGGNRAGTIAAYEVLLPELTQNYKLTAL
jgi:peptidoglycan/xylan/chitin deacetylase (PgdA/CDA1 family)